MTPDNQQDVEIKLTHLDKPTRIGVYAVNSLRHPPSQKSIDAYKFITDFNSDEAPKVSSAKSGYPEVH
ncbi:hypothetical protein ACHAPJ_006992 [Fusarium lateritium]